MSLHGRLIALTENLGEFAPNDPVPRQVAEVYNVLLEETKKVKGDDPIVSQAYPFQMASNDKYAHTSCGALRAVTEQLVRSFN
jgi:hypothetical protein